MTDKELDLVFDIFYSVGRNEDFKLMNLMVKYLSDVDDTDLWLAVLTTTIPYKWELPDRKFLFIKCSDLQLPVQGLQ